MSRLMSLLQRARMRPGGASPELDASASSQLYDVDCTPVNAIMVGASLYAALLLLILPAAARRHPPIFSLCSARRRRTMCAGLFTPYRPVEPARPLKSMVAIDSAICLRAFATLSLDRCCVSALAMAGAAPGFRRFLLFTTQRPVPETTCCLPPATP